MVCLCAISLIYNSKWSIISIALVGSISIFPYNLFGFCNAVRSVILQVLHKSRRSFFFSIEKERNILIIWLIVTYMDRFKFFAFQNKWYTKIIREKLMDFVLIKHKQWQLRFSVFWRGYRMHWWMQHLSLSM
jgi:hypothetical protein